MRRSVRWVSALLGVVVAGHGWAKVSIDKDSSKTIYNFSIDGVEFKHKDIAGMSFVEANLKGVGSYTAIRYSLGQPELPVLRMLVDGPVSVEFTGTNVLGTLPNNQKIKPSQPSWSKSQKFAPPVSFDNGVYSQNKMSTLPPFEIAKVGSIRGVPRYMVTLNAFSYNPVADTYKLNTGYRVTVGHARRAEESLQPTIAFVVGAKFASSPSLEILMNQKKSQGYRVRQITVGQNDVTSDVGVRNALKGILAEGVNLRHAILVGDIDDVPSHNSNTIDGVTDHFYRAIDTADYDSDINGPDIGVGRLSVSTEQQLSDVVSKIMRYTNGRFEADQWMQHPAFVTTHDRYQVAEGTHNAVIAKHLAPRGYDRVFPNANEKGGDKLFPITLGATPAQIVSHMKSGRFIINYSGHGSNTGWEDVTTDDVLSLDDPNALPWVISNACITGDFRKPQVFAETWLRHPAGAIVFWGSMDSSYWDEDDVLEKAMYDSVFTHGERTFDLIHQYALSDVWRYYGGQSRSKYYWETYVTFGDPSLGLRIAKSQDAMVDGPDAILVGSPSATWSVSSPNGPVVGARVAVARPSDGRTISGTTDIDGSVSLELGNLSAAVEPLKFVVTGGDLKLLERDLAMVAPNQAYFGFSQWTINGRVGSSVYGGEVVNLQTVVENVGGSSTAGGSVSIVGVSGPAVVMRSQADIPSLGSHDRHQVSSGLAFSVSADANRGDLVRVNFAWETREGQRGTFAMTWKVLRGELEVVSVDYGDSSIEGIGTSGDIFVTVKNSGSEDLKNTRLSATAGNCTSAVSGDFAVGDLAAGAIKRIEMPFSVSTDGICQSGSLGSINLVGSYQSVARRLDISSSAKYLVGVLEIDSERLTGLGLAIPDNAGQVTKAIKINGQGPVKDISVAIKINHTFIGDLIVKLVSPSGKEAVLHNRAGGSADVIDQRYGKDGLFNLDLKNLQGEEVGGDWMLVLRDEAASDVGTLDEVELTIRHW